LLRLLKKRENADIALDDLPPVVGNGLTEQSVAAAGKEPGKHGCDSYV
jgi:hypothetical protein